MRRTNQMMPSSGDSWQSNSPMENNGEPNVANPWHRGLGESYSNPPSRPPSAAESTSSTGTMPISEGMKFSFSFNDDGTVELAKETKEYLAKYATKAEISSVNSLLKVLGERQRKNIVGDREQLLEVGLKAYEEGQKLPVQKLRKWIPDFMVAAYDEREEDKNKRKVKHMWEKRPDDWPEDLAFGDPNNAAPGTAKLRKDDLTKVFQFLVERYKWKMSASAPTGSCEMDGFAGLLEKSSPVKPSLTQTLNLMSPPVYVLPSPPVLSLTDQPTLASAFEMPQNGDGRKQPESLMELDDYSPQEEGGDSSFGGLGILKKPYCPAMFGDSVQRRSNATGWRADFGESDLKLVDSQLIQKEHEEGRLYELHYNATTGGVKIIGVIPKPKQILAGMIAEDLGGMIDSGIFVSSLPQMNEFSTLPDSQDISRNFQGVLQASQAALPTWQGGTQETFDPGTFLTELPQFSVATAQPSEDSNMLDLDAILDMANENGVEYGYPLDEFPPAVQVEQQALPNGLILPSFNGIENLQRALPAVSFIADVSGRQEQPIYLVEPAPAPLPTVLDDYRV